MSDTESSLFGKMKIDKPQSDSSQNKKGGAPNQ